jgi:ankyrin repeat protein
MWSIQLTFTTATRDALLHATANLVLSATVHLQDGRTAVMVAAFGGNAEIITFLARSGADVNAEDNVRPACCGLFSMAHSVCYPLL